MTRLPILSLLAVIAACLFAPLAAWSQAGAPQGGPPMTREQHQAKLKADRLQRLADARAKSEAIRAEQRRVDAEQDANAQKEAEEANKRWEEMRARNAEQIKKFDDAIEDWLETADKPPGTVEDFVSSSYNEDTALGESARVVFYNRQDVPTHQVDFGPDGKPTGPITLTQQGKAWETIGPQLKDGAQWEPVYGRSPEGDVIIVSADIIKNGRVDTRFFFNEEGVPWKGERWSYEGIPPGEPGITRGGFYDPRLEPKPDTLGAGFDVPASHRLITGVCPQCREKADRYNELASRANGLLADMRVQSEEHKHHHRAAQLPIEQRYAHLKAELDALTPELEAARAAALECEKICRPPSKLPAPDLTRPSLLPVAKLEPPASFCDEFARVAYMNEVYTPAAKASLANAQTAAAHLGKLGGMFTDYMKNEGGPGWAAVRAEQTAYGPIAQTATDDSNAINAMYQRVLAIPIVPCPDQKPRVATGDPAPPPVAPATEDVGVIPARMVEQATGGKKPCPPKGPRKPIVVGPNSKVGSGAQLSKKLGGMLVGGLLGAAGVGGGGGGGGGPQLYKCTLKDSKLTLFKHPSGLTLGIGAQRGKGDNVLITADIQKAPDKGTFQAALLEKPGTQQLQPPSEVGPCDLWGEWELTVSWTKTTTVDGKVVSQESGGWSEGGKFTLPGQLSKVDNADALWKRMGFSSASHGAQKAIMAFKVPPGGGPLTFTTWITQPKGDPVMAVPITVTMTETAPGVFTFTEGEAEIDCPEPPVTTTVSTTKPLDPPKTGVPTMPPSDPYIGMTPARIWNELPFDLSTLRSTIDAGDANPCEFGYDAAIKRLADLRANLARARAGEGLGDAERQDMDEMSKRLDQIEAELAAKKAALAEKPCPKTTEAAPASTSGGFPTDDPASPESIMDDLEDEGTRSDPTFGSRPADPVPPKTPPGVSQAQARDNDSAVSNVAINDLISRYQTIDQFSERQLQENPCDEALRAKVIADLRARLAMIDDPKAPADARSAAGAERERTQALIDRLEKPSEQCTEGFDPPHKPMTTPTFDPAPAAYTEADEPSQPPPAPFDENPTATARKLLETQADEIVRNRDETRDREEDRIADWGCDDLPRYYYLRSLAWEYENDAEPGELGQLVWERNRERIRKRLAELLRRHGDCGKTVDSILQQFSTHPDAATPSSARPGADPANVDKGAHTRDPWMGDGPPPAPFDADPAATARKQQADDIAKTFDEEDKGWHVGEGDWDCGAPARFHYIQHLQNEYARGPDPGELGQLVWERKQAWVRQRLTEVLKEQGACDKTVDGILSEVKPFPSAKTVEAQEAAQAAAKQPPPTAGLSMTQAVQLAGTDGPLKVATELGAKLPEKSMDNLSQLRDGLAERSHENYLNQGLDGGTKACQAGAISTEEWTERRDGVLGGLLARLSLLLKVKPTGKDAAKMQDLLDQEKVRVLAVYDQLSEMTPPVCPPPKPGAAPPAPKPAPPKPDPEPESILDDIDEVFVPA